MSLDLVIIPTVNQPIRWLDLKKQWLAYMNKSQRQLVGTGVLLKEVGSHKLVVGSSLLELSGHYYFELVIPCTLVLGVSTNEQLEFAGYEQEIIEDYGRNLTTEVIRFIAQRWSSLGYGFDITSMGGRSKHESGLMVALASALAALCEGWIGVETTGFGDSPAMYTSEQFRIIDPEF
jgi:hypothetical protein